MTVVLRVFVGAGVIIVVKFLVREGIVRGVVVGVVMFIIVRDVFFFGEVFVGGRDFAVVVLGGKMVRGYIVKDTLVKDRANFISCVVGKGNRERWQIG